MDSGNPVDAARITGWSVFTGGSRFVLNLSVWTSCGAWGRQARANGHAVGLCRRGANRKAMHALGHAMGEASREQTCRPLWCGWEAG